LAVRRAAADLTLTADTLKSGGSTVVAWVPRNRRATLLPLLLLGVATAVGVAPMLPPGTGDGLAWLTIPLAFAAVRCSATRRPAQEAPRAPSPVSLWCLACFFGSTNRLPLSVWAAWEHPAIYLLLAVLTVLAGMATWLRENRAA
jgi:hypothetical protein